MLIKKFLAVALAAAPLLLTGCKDKDPASVEKNYPMEIRMTDAAGPYDAVIIDLQNIEVNVSDNANSGWTSLNARKGLYDLTKLTNGIDTLIANGNVPSGKISQIRLVLGSNNSIVKDGVTYPLSTPSAQQSGLKLQVHTTLTEGITYKILLDFDAARSIVESGNGKYSLKPVIRTSTQATSGAIKGKVEPASSRPSIIAVMGTDTSGTLADTLGNFMFKGLPAGSYNVMFTPMSPYKNHTVNSVSVINGQVTDMGTVTMPR